MPLPRALLCFLLGIVVTIGALGCGKKGPSTALVSGVVTLNGKPLPDAMVRFQPEGKEAGPPSTGTTGGDGKFKLQFADGKAGAAVGKHTVYFSTRKMKPAAEGSDIETELAKEQVPDLYRTTPLTFDVPQGGSDKAEFILTGPPPAGSLKPGQRPVRND